MAMELCSVLGTNSCIRNTSVPLKCSGQGEGGRCPCPPPWTMCYRPQQVHGEAIKALPASCLAANLPVTGLCCVN